MIMGAYFIELHTGRSVNIFTVAIIFMSDHYMDAQLLIQELTDMRRHAFKDASARWVTERVKIFRETDFLCLFASLPIDWFGYACGFSMEGCLWLRLNKMVLYYSSISPHFTLLQH